MPSVSMIGTKTIQTVISKMVRVLYLAYSIVKESLLELISGRRLVFYGDFTLAYGMGIVWRFKTSCIH